MATADEDHRRRRALALFAIVGALGGYLLHRFVGCPGGGCPITGNPWVATLYGSAVALVLGVGLRR
jgi:Family of unknown function (DUF6132)